jgi:hypothetical protein
MKEPKYDLYKFDDLIKSDDWPNNLMGIIMLKAYLPIKSLNLEELNELELNVKHICYGSFGYQSLFFSIRGAILNKINNQKQKIKKQNKKK